MAQYDFFGEDTVNTVQEKGETEGIVEVRDPLSLDIKDDTLVDTIDKYIKDSRSWFSTNRNLYERRKRNLTYYLGAQIQEMEKEGKFKEHEARYSDNIVWEGEATLKPIALSRIPDLIITTDAEDPEKQKATDALTDLINNQLRKRKQRWVLGRAYKHRPIFFTGVIKYLWNPELNDYEFVVVHPDNIDVDHTSPDNDVDNMRWVAHHYDLSVKEVMIRFPEKAQKFLEKVKEEAGVSKDRNLSEKGMATMVRISEIWFTWYKPAGEGKWEAIEGVMWKYKKIILKKMRNPNWDWEGEQRVFTYDDEGRRTPADENMVRQSIMNEDISSLRYERVYNNYFDHPEKPFIFLGYDQLGKMPYDETTRIEQVLYLQDNINKRGKQITSIADNSLGKNVFSTESGLTAEDIEEIDMSNPDQDILVKGEISKVHTLIPGQQPTTALFEEQEMNRTKAFSKMGAHATTRGEREAEETATGRQILREADIGKQDDEVSDTIDYASERMARAALQMIKLRYTEPKLKRLKGKNGQIFYQMISQDLVEDGMDVEVRASGTDKLRRKAEAYDMAGMQLIDPYTFYQDIDADDPKGRAERLLVFTSNPALYLQQFILDRDTAGMAAALTGGTVGGGAAQPNPQAAQQAMADIAQLMQGGTPPVPAQPDPAYVNAFNQFINSPEFNNASPEIKANVGNFGRQLLSATQQALQGAGATAAPAPAAPTPTPAMNPQTAPAQAQMVSP